MRKFNSILLFITVFSVFDLHASNLSCFEEVRTKIGSNYAAILCKGATGRLSQDCMKELVDVDESKFIIATILCSGVLNSSLSKECYRKMAKPAGKVNAAILCNRSLTDQPQKCFEERKSAMGALAAAHFCTEGHVFSL